MAVLIAIAPTNERPGVGMSLRAFVAAWFAVAAALVCVLPTGVALGVWGCLLLCTPARLDPPHRFEEG